MSTYTNPAINQNNVEPIGLDAAIESIRVSLATISWNAKSFGRAWAVKEKDLTTGKLLTIPKAYTLEGDYQNVLPNDAIFTDTVAGSSFIAVIGDETYEDFQPHTGSTKTAKLAVVVWCNLEMIDPSRDYIFNETLKKDLAGVIKINQYVKTIDSWVEEKPEKVFEGYDLSDNFYTVYLQYPYYGVRIDITVGYPEAC